MTNSILAICKWSLRCHLCFMIRHEGVGSALSKACARVDQPRPRVLPPTHPLFSVKPSTCPTFQSSVPFSVLLPRLSQLVTVYPGFLPWLGTILKDHPAQKSPPNHSCFQDCQFMKEEQAVMTLWSPKTQGRSWCGTERSVPTNIRRNRCEWRSWGRKGLVFPDTGKKLELEGAWAAGRVLSCG